MAMGRWCCCDDLRKEHGRAPQQSITSQPREIQAQRERERERERERANSTERKPTFGISNPLTHFDRTRTISRQDFAGVCVPNQFANRFIYETVPWVGHVRRRRRGLSSVGVDRPPRARLWCLFCPSGKMKWAKSVKATKSACFCAYFYAYACLCICVCPGASDYH